MVGGKFVKSCYLFIYLFLFILFFIIYLVLFFVFFYLLNVTSVISVIVVVDTNLLLVSTTVVNYWLITLYCLWSDFNNSFFIKIKIKFIYIKKKVC